MPSLLDAYDAYKDFTRSSYYTISFDSLPSNLRFETPLDSSKENMDAVLAAFDFKKLQLKQIFKNWSTENDKDSDPAKDYAHQHLFRSETKSLTVWISIDNNELFVDFHYDAADHELEKEVIAINQMLRTRFGAANKPTFKVLSKSSHSFYTEDVRTEVTTLDIKAHYNDDFQEINGIIEASMEQEKSGLILLHGAPGTGKTTYIKSLISKFNKKPFIFVQNEFIRDLLSPEFISFLLTNRNSILIIEDAEKVITSRESAQENSVVSTILQLTDGLFSDYLNIKIICTFNTNINRVDKALMRKGRMIANYEFKPLAPEKSNKLLKEMGHEGSETGLALADIFNYATKNFDAAGNKKKIGF